MIRFVLVASIAVAGIGMTLWVNRSQQAPSAADRNFFEAPRHYPLNGGQEMRPRWKAGEGATDAAAN